MKKMILLFLLLLTFSHATPLSTAEMPVINKSPLKCISTGEWAPFNLVENNKLTGIGLDYWYLIENKLDIKSHCSLAKNWTEVLASIKNHTADITIAAQNTQKRSQYAVFSKPYARYPIVIVTKNDTGFIDDINLLRDKTIVVGKNYTTVDILKKHYPLLHLKYVGSIDEALKQVNDSKAFATIGILPVVAYKLNRHAFPNLKISGSIRPYFSLSIMVRKDYAALLPLINKAIDTISTKEKDEINKKWITLRYEEKISRKYFYALLIGSGILFLFFMAWLYLLKKEISRKNKTTKELERLVTIDTLTSVCNRYMFDSTLDKEIALYRRHGLALSLIFFDIDGFKHINDIYGHKVGDTILKELATLVSEHIRTSDTFCRWGGDEFIIILPNTTEVYAQKLSENLDLLIRKAPFTHHISLSCSFGVTQFREEDTHLSLMSRIDYLLYDSKNMDTESP